MKVTFIYPDIIGGPYYKGYFYTGIGYLSSVLKQAGHNISLIHITQPICREEFIHNLKVSQPNIVAFSTTTNMFHYVKIWSQWVKEEMDVLIVCGGVHPTLNPEEVISYKHIDIVCVGEGEGALIELCEAMAMGQEFFNIKNLWVKANERVYRNSLRPLIRNLDVLPFPDRTIYDYPSLYHEREKRAIIMASRGCPYNCAYCCNHALKHTFKGLGSYIRFRSVANVITKIKQIIANYPFVTALAFDDDILPINRKWLVEFTDSYAHEVALPFSCNVHPALINGDVVRILKEAGCVELHVGIESGNEQIRNKVLNRNISNENILRALSFCKKEDLQVYTYNMVGVPFEGIKEMLDTVKLNVKYSDINQVSIFFPYKGTKLYEVCKEGDLLSSKTVTDYFQDTMLNYPQSKRNQILFIRNYFRILVRFYSALDRLPQILTKYALRLLTLCSVPKFLHNCFSLYPTNFFTLFILVRPYIK